MAFDKNQFRGLIVDVLREADLYSESAVELLMLTCAVESNFGTYIEQITGPALGVFQMEPNTHDDIWANYLRYKDEPYGEANFYSSDKVLIGTWHERYPTPDNLKWSLAYSIIMARVHYLRVPEALPESDDVIALAHYWKRYYNTRKGKGTPEKAIKKYKEYCI